MLIRIITGEEGVLIVAIGVFVDDLLVAGNVPLAVENLQQQMSTRFEFTDQGRIEYNLGVEFKHEDDKTLLLHQHGYIKKILETFNMTECKPVSTPLPVNLDLSLKDSPEEVDPKLQAEYRAIRSIVGSLMNLYQWTRPDLGFAVTFLSRYLHKPGIKHLQTA
jgi:hypothetical protein